MCEENHRRSFTGDSFLPVIFVNDRNPAVLSIFLLSPKLGFADSVHRSDVLVGP